MEQEQLLKNRYDNEYQSLLTLRNIFWASALGSVIAVWNLLRQFNVAAGTRAVATTAITMLPLVLGLVSWSRARQKLDEITSLD